MSKKWVVFSIATTLSLSLYAEDEKKLETCPSGPRPMHLSLRHIEGKGIGYNTGYTTLEAFLTIPHPKQFLPFLDLRGHVFDNGRFAANAGLGARYLSTCTVFGVNAYYDFRNTKRHSYNQVGLGLEALGSIWEFRANGYLPVGSKRSEYFKTKFDSFKGNDILIQRKVDFAMKGIDAEAGAHFYRKKNIDLYAGAGPYVFAGHFGKAAIGGKARLSARTLKYINLELSGSYDSVFHGIVQGQVGLIFPLGPNKIPSRDSNKRCYSSCSEEYALQSRFVEPVVRQEIIVVDRHKKRQKAINPATGLPYHVLFVNNLSSSNGTFESPYSTLAVAEGVSQPNDIIYVFTGDGTPNGMNTGITLKSGQKLFGSGVAHPLATTVKKITIPQMTDALPIITNAGGSSTIVNLASQTEVAGLRIHDPSLPAVSSGIKATTSVANVVIRNNIIQLSQGSGIGIVMEPAAANTTQSFSILNNFISGTFLGNGIEINVSNLASCTQNFIIDGNTITNFAGTGIDVGSTLSSGGNLQNIQNGTITNNILQGVNDPNNFTAASGVNFFAHDGTSHNIVMTHNTISGCDTSAYSINVAGVGAFTTSNYLISGNTFEGNGGALSFISGVDKATVDFTFTDNIANNYSEMLISLQGGIPGQGPSFMSLNISDNTFVTSVGRAVTVDLNFAVGPPQAAICMRLNNNQANPVISPPSAMYTLNNFIPGNVFRLETPVGNVGAISATNVTTVAPGTCFPK